LRRFVKRFGRDAGARFLSSPVESVSDLGSALASKVNFGTGKNWALTLSQRRVPIRTPRR
jgi:hypothetical protein